MRKNEPMDVLEAVKSKENYSSIVTYFKAMNTLDTAQIAVLIDTIEQMSEEIFEHYKALQIIFKREVKRLLKDAEIKGGLREALSPEELGQFLNSIQKACDMGVLLPEKYENIG